MGAEFGAASGKPPILLSHTHLITSRGCRSSRRSSSRGNEIRILGANPTTGASLEATLQNQPAPHYSPLNGLENPRRACRSRR